MNKFLLTLFVISCTCFCLHAQTSKKSLSYQAVILDPKPIQIPGEDITGQALINKTICLKFTFLTTANDVIYEEIQSITTDDQGLVNTLIGTGVYSKGLYKSFDQILWDNTYKTLAVSVSYDNCQSFQTVSRQALSYTPYALYAESAEYNNVRNSPKNLSEFKNDAGYLLPKDLDPIKNNITSVQDTISLHKKWVDAEFVLTNQRIRLIENNITGLTNSLKSIDNQFSEQKNRLFDINFLLNTTNKRISDIDGSLGYTLNQINENRNQINSNTSSLTNQINSIQAQINALNAPPSASLLAGYQTTANLSTDLLADYTSTEKYPSVKTIKDYVDERTQLALASSATYSGAIPDGSVTTNKIADNSVTDSKIISLSSSKLTGIVSVEHGGTGADNAQDALRNLGAQSISNISSNIATEANPATTYPSVQAVKTYVEEKYNSSGSFSRVLANIVNNEIVLESKFTSAYPNSTYFYLEFIDEIKASTNSTITLDLPKPETNRGKMYHFYFAYQFLNLNSETDGGQELPTTNYLIKTVTSDGQAIDSKGAPSDPLSSSFILTNISSIKGFSLVSTGSYYIVHSVQRF